MVEVAFHFNVPERLGYACRLLRKAAARRMRVVVSGPRALLTQLDAQLWTFGQAEFIPHCLDSAPAAVLEASPIVLREDPASGDSVGGLLVNLHDEAPPGFERYDKLIEIVTLDEADRLSARRRWRQYAQHGCPIERHDIVQKGSA